MCGTSINITVEKERKEGRKCDSNKQSLVKEIEGREKGKKETEFGEKKKEQKEE